MDNQVAVTDLLASEAATGEPLWIVERAGRLGIALDPMTGLPVALEARYASGRTFRMPLRWSATIRSEGREVEGHPFGLAYADTIDLSGFRLDGRAVQREFAGYDEVHTVTTVAGDWSVAWHYRFRGSAPRLEVEITLAPRGGTTGTIRNVVLTLDVAPDNLDQWTIEAPGSGVRPGIPATAIERRTTFSEACFSGSGVLFLHSAAERAGLLIWPFSRTEHSINRLERGDGCLSVSIETGLAARIGPDESVRWGGIELDLFEGPWDELRPTAKSWLEAVGVSKPVDTAGWIPGCTIFEVQIGTSLFWNGYEYSPYPKMRDLYDDLGRIAGLGFDCIQIMPRQPFPSYNVYDYADITLSYGDESDLKRVVDGAHALGMNVILDILMHGVIDADVIGRAADRVRNGPYFPRLNEGTDITPDPEFAAYDGQDYLVSWSRHIIDFERHWAEGSPGEHPLVSEHPEWFVRDSSGAIIGVYTKAFDVSNLEWQEYFTAAALHLMRELDIDGFRFDAPTYNEFPNWSPATEKRASAQQLGSVQHFARLRPLMKSVKPEAMLYTEPSGTLFRETMDITYNYDEHWLIHSLLRPERALARNPLGIRHARDLAAWFRDKEAVLPRGAITARHIDSHDTFWWPLPGFKWRREQYGLPATRALVAIWSLLGGVYMTFVGGEAGLEDEIRRMNRLRAELPEIRYGGNDFDRVRAASDHVFAVARAHGDSLSLVLVNVSNAPVETTIACDPPPGHTGGFTVYDTWNDVAVEGNDGYAWSAGRLSAFDMSFAPFQARVLTIRSIDR